MRFDSRQLKAALSFVSYDKPDNVPVETTMREEDMGKGQICSSMTMTATWSKPAAKYDDNKAPITVVKIVEIFPEEENRPPRASNTESRELLLN